MDYPALIVFGTILVIILFFILRYFIWVIPHNKIKELTKELTTTKNNLNGKIDATTIRYEQKLLDAKKLYNNKIELLTKENQKLIRRFEERLNNTDAITLHLVEHEFNDILVANRWNNFQYAKDFEIKDEITGRFIDAITDQYKYKYLSYVYPEIISIFEDNVVDKSKTLIIDGKRSHNLFNAVKTLSKPHTEKTFFEELNKIFAIATSNLKAIPYMAQIAADLETYGLESLAKRLDWGRAEERLKKVKTIREIRKDAKEIVERNKEAQYQLAYLLELYPELQDVIECEFNNLPIIEIKATSEEDAVQGFLSKEEYLTLSTSERNQLALDRYKNSRKKTKWQIGRDYEQYVGYKYTQEGFQVDNFGTYMGLEDMGRDIIAKKGMQILIIQCKYWSSSKLIHEKHITQLYGTMVSYCIENKVPHKYVKGVLITNIQLSETAKKIADYLKIEYVENYSIGDYPCIKCNIGHDTIGRTTKIYHLPFDQQYDFTKIEPHKGEFYAATVKEAEDAGFRRANKWHANSNSGTFPKASPTSNNSISNYFGI